MTSTDLYLLHPVAWAVCQEVLQAESDMLASGQSAEQRAAFLEHEQNRVLATAQIALPEAYSGILQTWGLADAAADLPVIRERFGIHGSRFTFRESRNRLRRIGINDNALASPLFALGLLLIGADPETAESVRRILEPRVRWLVEHPEVANADGIYEEITRNKELLPTERDRKIMRLAQGVFSRMGTEMDGLVTFERSEYRDLARIRGALLDLGVVQVLETAIENGLIPEVRQLLLTSVDEGLTIYRQVVRTILGERITTLRVGQGANQVHTEDPETEHTVPVTPWTPDTASESVTDPAPAGSSDVLLTVNQAAELLQVSRSTLGRLAKDGVLLPIRIGRTVRYDSQAIEVYLDRHRKPRV